MVTTNGRLEMRRQFVAAAAASALLLVAGPGLADHNSKDGEGTANMPNDIHNTRIETLETNDSEAFRDFVQYGEGSKTVNRFDSEETQPNQAQEQKGDAQQKKNMGEDPSMNKNKVETQTKSQGRTRIETRTRLQPGASNMSRPDRSSTSGRDRGGRKGGGKR